MRSGMTTDRLRRANLGGDQVIGYNRAHLDHMTSTETIVEPTESAPNPIAPPPDQAADAERGAGITRAAGIVAACNVLSSVLGLEAAYCQERSLRRVRLCQRLQRGRLCAEHVV